MKKTNHLTIGSLAPDFTLNSNLGTVFNLKKSLGKKIIVLFFYPKNNTPGCTKESIMFRDSFHQFQNYNAELIGISSDTVESHCDFISKYNLPFILLSDPNNKVRKLYSSYFFLNLFPGRDTFIIDQNGVIQYIFSSQFKINQHIIKALKIVKKLKSI